LRWLVLSLAVAAGVVAALANPVLAQPQPQFVLGFKTLADMIPDIVGQPLENEHFNPQNGDALQMTTHGLLVWRKADNWTAFTDGATTWVDGPYGLQGRPDDTRFAWEPSSAASAAAQPAVGSVNIESTTVAGYQECLFTDPLGRTMYFLLYVPASGQPQQKYPLVLVLEGSGEEALPGMTPSQGLALLDGHPYVACWIPDPSQLNAPNVQSRWPSFIVIPEIAYPSRWVDVPGSQGSFQLAPTPTVELQMAKEIVDALQQKYSGVDSNRLYVTGISMGGYGTWDAIERWPGYFAAAAPVSGAGDPSKASELKDLPIWAFQGGADDPTLVLAVRAMISAIEVAGGQPKYTEYPGGGHDIFALVYNVAEPNPSANLFHWLFAQHKGG
jgi:predicted peptidase